MSLPRTTMAECRRCSYRLSFCPFNLSRHNPWQQGPFPFNHSHRRRCQCDYFDHYYPTWKSKRSQTIAIFSSETALFVAGREGEDLVLGLNNTKTYSSFLISVSSVHIFSHFGRRLPWIFFKLLENCPWPFFWKTKNLLWCSAISM